MSKPSTEPDQATQDLSQLRVAQLRFGWGAIVIFMVGGVVLESLHGFKVGWYLDVGNETRRLMFQLAHAHGTLFGLINILFALSIDHLKDAPFPRSELASRGLKFATVMIPGGFFAGGLIIYDGDPGLGIIAVPLGALAAIASAYLTYRAFKGRSKGS